MTVLERRSLIWGTTVVVAIAAAWLTPPPPDRAEDPRAMRPFADLVLTDVRARHLHGGPGGRASGWVVTYDIKAVKHVRCPGGLDVIRTIYEVIPGADNAIEPKWTVIQPEVSEMPVTGLVELANAEIPLSLPLEHGQAYEAQVSLVCLNEKKQPVGLQAISQRFPFVARDDTP